MKFFMLLLAALLMISLPTLGDAKPRSARQAHPSERESVAMYLSLIVITKKEYPHIGADVILTLIEQIERGLNEDELLIADQAELIMTKVHQRLGGGIVGIQDRPTYDALYNFFVGPKMDDLIKEIEKNTLPPGKAVLMAVIDVFARIDVQQLDKPNIVPMLIEDIVKEAKNYEGYE